MHAKAPVAAVSKSAEIFTDDPSDYIAGAYEPSEGNLNNASLVRPVQCRSGFARRYR